MIDGEVLDKAFLGGLAGLGYAVIAMLLGYGVRLFKKRAPPTASSTSGKVVINCPKCNQKLRVGLDKSGIVECPACHNSFHAVT